MSEVRTTEKQEPKIVAKKASNTKTLKKGENNFSIGNKNYNKGTYILNIKGRTIKSTK